MLSFCDLSAEVETLLASGYEPIPAVGKRPVADLWQSRDPREQFEAHPGAGNIGIRTGRVVGVDSDITDLDLLEAVDELTSRHLGPTPLARIGAKGMMQVYQTATPCTKIRVEARPGEKGAAAVEFLGTGQQFVAYGIHPDTNQPYDWPNSWADGEPLQTAVADLPLVTPDMLMACAQAIRELFLARGHANARITQGSRERQENAGQLAEGVEFNTARAIEAVTAYLKRAEPAVEGAHGDDHTIKVLNRALDYAVTPDVLLPLVDEHWNSRCIPSWDDDGLLGKLQSAVKSRQNAIGTRAEIPEGFKAIAGKKKPTGVFGGARSINAAAVPPKSLSFLWHPYLVRGRVNLLGGRGGCGKGLVAIAVAAAITTGERLPCGLSAPKGRVLWCETEDALDDTLVPRLQAAGADLSQVEFVNPRQFTFEGLMELIAEFRPVLIVMSPLVSFLRGLVDFRDEMQVRDSLEQLQEVLDATGATLLGIGHLNKKADLAAIDRLLGSVAFANFVRSVLMAAPEPEQESEYRLVHAKYNASRKGADLCYHPRHVGEDKYSQHVRLDWSKPEQNVETDTMFDKRKPDDNSSARAWLVWRLQDTGEMDRRILIKEGQEAGYSPAAIDKAKQRSPRILHRCTRTFPPMTLWRLAGQQMREEA